MKLILPLLVSVICLAFPNLAHATDGTFDSKGVNIHYVTEGEGEPVVLIHGWMGDSSMWGRDAKGNTKLDAKPLPGFEVIALDCRGHGQSDKPHDPAMYGVEMAEDVVRLLNHLKLKRAHLIGYSMGAFIAGKVAATHPERVLSIIYGGQAPLITGVHPSGSSEIDVFAKAVDEGNGLGAYWIEVAPPGTTKPTMEQANAVTKYLFKGKDVQAFAAAGRSFKGLEVTLGDLQKCKAPTLFIYGGLESEGSRNSIEAVRKVLGESQVKVVDRANHVTTPINPVFGATLIEFLVAHKTKTESI